MIAPGVKNPNESLVLCDCHGSDVLAVIDRDGRLVIRAKRNGSTHTAVVELASLVSKLESLRRGERRPEAEGQPATCGAVRCPVDP